MPQAEREMRDSASYIAQASIENALKWLADLQHAIRGLSRMPGRCPKAPEADYFARDIRQLVHQRYRILFVVHASRVQVIHVRHGARLPIGHPDSPDKDL